jgi:HK97 family phage portal protein
MGGKAQYLEVNYETIVKHGWRKNELIFACTEKISNTASQVALKVIDKKTKKELPDHDLQKLIKRPNGGVTEYEFWRTSIATMWLAGDCFYEIERSRSGKPVALWWLRPDWVTVIPSMDRKKHPDGVARYEYHAPGTEATPLKKSDMLVFKGFDPINPHRGWSRAAVAARVGAADNEATDFVTAFWQNNGVPTGLLKTKAKITDTIAREIRQRWAALYHGIKNMIKAPAVLGHEAEYQKVGLDFKEMDFKNLDQRSEVRICMVMDVPPVIVGALIGLLRSTYDNVENAQKMWWHNTLVPLYEYLDDQLMEKFAVNFGDDIELKWDFTKVPALQEDTKELWARNRYAFTDGVMKLNEAREGIGLDRDEEFGDLYVWQMYGMISDALSTDDSGGTDEGDKQRSFVERLRKMNQMLLANRKRASGQGQALSLQKDDSDSDSDILTYGSKAHIAYMERKDEEVAPWEDVIQEKALSQFEAQWKRVNERMEGFKSLPAIDDLFQLSSEINIWFDAFEEDVEAAVAALGEDEMLAVGGEGFAIDRPAVREKIEEILNTLSIETNNTTYQALIEVLQQAESEGVEMAELQERINVVYEGRMKPYETERIARTTLTQANGEHRS